jgi:autotransporter-associated beta strand protein
MIVMGETVPLEIYLVGGDTDLANGLGSFNVGVRSFNELVGTSPWFVARTPTDTPVNASGGQNATDPTILDLGFSHGTNTDSTAGVGNPDPNDTDLDRIDIKGTQSASGGWSPGYGKVHELLLGTAQFTAPFTITTFGGGWWKVDLNAFFSNSSGSGGGAVIKTLTGSSTTTNGVSATNLITSSVQFAAPVKVDVYDILSLPAIFRWDGGATGSGTQWLEAANWGDRITSAQYVPGATDRATFGAYGTNPPPVVGIDFSSPLTNNGPANVIVAGIDVFDFRNLSIINSSTTPGVLTLSGTSLVRTEPYSILTIGASGGAMTIALQQSGTINVVTQAASVEIAAPITGSGKGITKTGAGLLILSAPNTYSGGTTVNAGTLSVKHQNALGGGGLTITGGKADIIAGLAEPLKLPSLSITGGTLDLNDNSLIVQNGNASSLAASYKAGRITPDAPALTTLAIASNSELGKGTFGGVPVVETDVLAMITYAGDANLSGNVDADDYFQIDSNFNKPPATLRYAKGDFNYDGQIDGDDFQLIDASFSGQGDPFSPGLIAGGVTSVPEPAAVGLLLVLAAAIARGSRRKRPPL